MSRPSYPRMRRVNAIIQEVLADEIERLTDPRLDLVSVTGVDTAPDLRHATVFVSAVDLADIEAVLAALRAAGPRLRAAVGREVRIKYTPELEFAADRGVVSGERIESLLRRMKQAATEEGEPPNDHD
jgi:ribosome-binding factor A